MALSQEDRERIDDLNAKLDRHHDDLVRMELRYSALQRVILKLLRRITPEE